MNLTPEEKERLNIYLRSIAILAVQAQTQNQPDAIAQTLDDIAADAEKAGAILDAVFLREE